MSEYNRALDDAKRVVEKLLRDWLDANQHDEDDQGGYPPWHYVCAVDAIEKLREPAVSVDAVATPMDEGKAVPSRMEKSS